ncbi:MAG: TrmH family RNA methyltransferase, partial [Rhizobacter sp.]
MAVRTITSRDNALLARVRKLAGDPAAYRKLGEVWIEGEHLCAAYLERRSAPTLAVIGASGWDVPRLRRLAEAAPQTVLIPDAVMKGLSLLESPAPLGFVVPWSGVGELAGDQPSVVLDRLQDAGNVGSVLRSASALGFRQVIALKGTAALWSPKVLRAGMGAHFGLQLIEGVTDAALSALTMPIYAASSHARRALHECALAWPCAWVLGHEGQGV